MARGRHSLRNLTSLLVSILASTALLGAQVEVPSSSGRVAGAARVGFEQLKNCMADNAVEIPSSNHVPRSAKGVTLDQWRDHLLKIALINAKGNHREQFKRIRVTLQNAKAIGIWEDFAWPVT